MKIDRDTCEEILVTITRNKSRSLLTAFGVFWGIFMLLSLVGGGQGLSLYMRASFKGFANNSGFIFADKTSEAYKGFRKGRSWNMTTDDIDLLKNSVRELDIVSPCNSKWGLTAVNGEKTSSCSMCGVYPDYREIDNPKLTYGRFINESDMRDCRRVCLIGSKVQQELFGDGVDPCGKYIKVGSVYMMVIGVMSGSGAINIQGDNTQKVIIPFSTMQSITSYGNSVQIIGFTVKPGVRVSAVKDKVSSVLKRAHYIAPDDEAAVQLLNTEAMFSLVDNLFSGISILVWMVGIGTLLAGTIGVSNIMMVTVKERTSEIGIRRAIGARPRDILEQIIAESITLTTVAGMFGISFAVFVLNLVDGAMGDDASDVRFQVSFGMAIMTLLIIIVLGVLAGLAPAYRAMAIKPIEAIREE
jgi:putative ABC transport system permease protein